MSTLHAKLDQLQYACEIACVAWRFCRAGRTSGEERRSREKNKNQSPRGFSALARLYLATKTAMLRRLEKRWK